jgi:cell division protein FtsZ
MTINLHLPGKTESLRPTITVIGVGGAGGNAVNNMISSSLEGVNFVVANTDAQALENALTERRIQLGATITRGLGAGASPEVGRAAAEEAMDEIAGYIDGSNMVFITAGMGGGTGTGAAPVVARLAKERGILTVGVVTKPFQFEGGHRMRLAEQGLHDLQEYVDTLIVIPNQNLFRIANEKTTFADAFRMADEVLHSGVRGVTDLMVMPGLINLDFADIRTVMREMGKAMMGTGEGEGAKRAIDAAEAAISNPLLDDVSMKGARGVLINITGGYDMTLYEADEAATRIRQEVDPEANIIFGATFNPALEGKIRVSVVATGIDGSHPNETNKPQVTENHQFYRGKIGFPPRQQEPRPTAPVPAFSRAAEPQVRESVKQAQQTHEPALAHRAATRETTSATTSPSGQHAPYQATQAMDAFAITSTASAMLPPPQEPAVTFASKVRTSVGAATQVPQGAEAQSGNTSAAQREPAFISPQPAQPAQRSFFGAQSEPETAGKSALPSARISPRDQTSYGTQSREQPSNSMSFFHRMANVGRVLTAKPEQPERALHMVKKAKVEVTEHTAQPSAEDAYLEIPAFLRRQAN